MRNIVRILAFMTAIGLGVSIMGQPLVAQERDTTVSASQTVNGVTLRLTAGWITPGEMSAEFQKAPDHRKGEDPYGTEHNAKVLGMWYEVQTDDLKLRPARGNTWAQYISSLRATGPSGEQLHWLIAGPQMGWWQNAKPSWRRTTVNFEMLDPAAPPGANGAFTETLEIEDVPLPAEIDKPLKVNRTLMTGRGTRLTLEQVMLTAQAENNGEVKQDDTVQVRTVCFIRAAPQLPGVYGSLHQGWQNVIDDQGRTLVFPKQKWVISYQSGSYRGYSSRSHEEPELIKLVVLAAPAAGAKSVDIPLGVREWAPSLKQPQWYRHFSFDLNPRAIPSGKRHFKPLAVYQKGGLQVVLETFVPGITLDDFYAKLWIRSRQQQPGSNLEWIITGYGTRDDKGVFHPHLHFGDIGIEYEWKEDGSPMADNGRGLSIKRPLHQRDRLQHPARKAHHPGDAVGADAPDSLRIRIRAPCHSSAGASH